MDAAQRIAQFLGRIEMETAHPDLISERVGAADRVRQGRDFVTGIEQPPGDVTPRIPESPGDRDSHARHIRNINRPGPGCTQFRSPGRLGHLPASDLHRSGHRDRTRGSMNSAPHNTTRRSRYPRFGNRSAPRSVCTRHPLQSWGCRAVNSKMLSLATHGTGASTPAISMAQIPARITNPSFRLFRAFTGRAPT